MAEIQIDREPTQEKLDELGVTAWPIWRKEASVFPWTYDEPETCYVLEGEVTVTPEGGAPVEIQAGNLVTFPAGMSCRWAVKQDIRKHYRFG